MVVLSKGRKPDKFESHNFLTLSFTNIRGLRSSFVECTSFLELNSPDILALCETNLDDSFREFPCDKGGVSSFNPKGFCYSYAWSCSSCEEWTSFCKGRISRKLCGFFFYLCDSLYFIQCLTSLSSIVYHPLRLYAQLLMLFYLAYMRFSKWTDLLMCLSLETLTYITRTD